MAAARWTDDDKLWAAARAPMHRAMLRPDTQVIERPGWYQLVTPSAPGTTLNEVIWSELESAEIDRIVAEVSATYAATGHPVKWCVGPWTKPADFGPRLASLGFSSWGVRGMVAATSQGLRPPDGVDVSEVVEADLGRYIDAMIHGWSLPADQVAAERETHCRALRAQPRQAHFFIASTGNEVIGTAALIVRGDHGYLAATQVLSAFRGRGAYRALVAARLAFLAARGITLAVTQARAATSAPMLEHLGFETVFHSECYLRETTTAPQNVRGAS
jgi:GNAT superfamily N-acetyltransferase